MRKYLSLMNNPNPQGKGQVPVLSLLKENRIARDVPAKPVQQITGEWFTSLFVLRSRFRFKPVVGGTYWLYRNGDRFSLSLIAPWQWHGVKAQHCVGRCCLQEDLIWTLEQTDEAIDDRQFQDLLAELWRQFIQSLAVGNSMQESLPAYDQTLNYYARVFAAGMAHSLRISMRKTGVHSLAYHQAKQLQIEPTPSKP